LDTTRIQTDKLELEVNMQDIAELVRDVVRMQQVSWPGREITLNMPQGPVNVPCDADRIRQVLTNLLTNALKYSEHTCPVQVQVKEESGQVRLAVIDHGPGLTAEQQEHLFDAFVQAEGIRQQAAHSAGGAGLGLGLFICQAVVRQHKGEIGVESKAGSGSNFWFTLPVNCEY
jgi:signal transduction histidine kinase